MQRRMRLLRVRSRNIVVIVSAVCTCACIPEVEMQSTQRHTDNIIPRRRRKSYPSAKIYPWKYINSVYVLYGVVNRTDFFFWKLHFVRNSEKNALWTNGQKRLCSNSISNGRTKRNLFESNFERTDKKSFSNSISEKKIIRHLRLNISKWIWLHFKMQKKTYKKTDFNSI